MSLFSGRLALLFFSLIFSLSLHAQSITQVTVDLTQAEKNRLSVMVTPPALPAGEARFIIPRIIPGTYMQVDYERFYSHFTAYDAEGNHLKIKKKDHQIIIPEGQKLHHLQYTVKHTFMGQRIWNAPLGCSGSIFLPGRGFMINYQLLTGYFQGFKDQPFNIQYIKPEGWYGATGLSQEAVSPTEDRHLAKSYNELIDNPVIFAKADTASFRTEQGEFHVAVFSETGNITAANMAPKLEEMMQDLEDFTGTLPAKDYSFLLWYVDMKHVKGPFGRFTLGSALEHLRSSLYYMPEPADPKRHYINHMGSHEYLHTWAPLTLHSEKVDDFNFEEPDMSRHLWLYEGITDYLAVLANDRYDMPYASNLRNTLPYAYTFSNNRKPRSMTESSRQIIKRNQLNWFPKLLQLVNFYERGKVLGLCLDMELMMLTDGQWRLNTLMESLAQTYAPGQPFDDETFLDTLVARTHPSLEAFFDRYVVGKEIPDLDPYLQKLGWVYLPKKTKVPSYGNFSVWYNADAQRYWAGWVKRNVLGLEKGDFIISINGTTMDIAGEANGLIKQLYQPEANQDITLVIERDGEQLTLTGQATETKKLRYAQIREVHNPTDVQLAFRAQFFDRPEEK